MIEVDLVTPLKSLLKGAKAGSVKLPGIEGEIEILPGHTELMTLLGPGPLVVIEDGKEKAFAISYGFAEIRGDKVIVLAETAEEATAVDRERAVSAKKKAQEKLGGVMTREEFVKFEKKLQRAIVRENIVGK